MVIVLQLFIFFAATFIRGRLLFGWHLKESPDQNGTLTYTARHKDLTFVRHIGIMQHNGIPFVIRRETWYHRELKRLGISSEIKVSNANFDKRYFVTTDYPGHLEQILTSKELIVSLRRLFRHRIKSLHATPDRLWCVIERKDFDRPDKDFAGHVNLLQEISKFSDATFARDHAPPKSRKLGLIALVFIAFHAGLLTLGILGVFPTYLDSIDMVNTQAWIWKGAAYGVAVAAIWLLAMLTAFNRTSWISWVLMDFFLCGLLGFILSGIYAVREANIHLAQPTSQIQEKSVVRKSCILHCSTRGNRYTKRSISFFFEGDASCNPQVRELTIREKRQSDFRCAVSAAFRFELQVRHWRSPDIYTFSPTVFQFDSVATGDILKIPVNAGALGLEWVNTEQIRAK